MKLFSLPFDKMQKQLWIAACWILSCGAVQAQDVTVFAASSLRDALSEVAVGYEDATGANVTLVFAASSAIARQIVQGAPADVGVFADTQWADWVVEQGVDTRPDIIAGNRLVLIGPVGAPVIDDLGDLADTLGDRVLAMASLDAVPAGRYGRAALVSAGVWDAVSPSVVQAANVRAALRFVQRQEAAFGVGYASDLVALEGLSTVHVFATDSHAPIVYPGLALTEKGQGFLAYIQSDAGQFALLSWGFLPPPVAP